MSSRDVAAVVVSFGHRASLPTALGSLSRIGPGLREIVVVDNGGDLGEGWAAPCSPIEPSVVVPGSNLGYAAAVNLAAGRAQGELLLLLSPDAEILTFRPQEVDESLAPDVGALGALTTDSRDRPSVSWGEFPGVSRMLRRVSGARARFDRRALTAAASGQPVTVPWVVGAAVLVPHRTFDRLGGYDPFYAAAGEDQDFGRRLVLRGLRSVVSSSWRVRHEPRAAETMMGAIRRNEIRFLERHGSRLDRLVWTLAHGTRRR